jgi:hypothetical protein
VPHGGWSATPILFKGVAKTSFGSGQTTPSSKGQNVKKIKKKIRFFPLDKPPPKLAPGVAWPKWGSLGPKGVAYNIYILFIKKKCAATCHNFNDTTCH